MIIRTSIKSAMILNNKPRFFFESEMIKHWQRRRILLIARIQWNYFYLTQEDILKKYKRHYQKYMMWFPWNMTYKQKTSILDKQQIICSMTSQSKICLMEYRGIAWNIIIRNTFRQKRIVSQKHIWLCNLDLKTTNIVAMYI